MSLRTHLLAGALAGMTLAAGAATTASAQSTLDFALHDTSYTIAISDPIKAIDAYDAPEVMTVHQGILSTSYLAFCIDLFHDINPPVTGLTYSEQPLSSFTFGTLNNAPLSKTQVAQIAQLADYGSTLWTGKVSNLDAQLSGVQDAIWQVEFPTSAGFSYQANPSVASYASADLTYVADHPKGEAMPFAILPQNDIQSFVATGAPGTMPTGTGGFTSAPEPAGWALMLVGVGVVGGALRQRRRPIVAAA